MHHRSKLAAISLALCLATPAHVKADAPGASELEEGAALLAPFKRDLMAALRDGLAKGPVEAIAACRIRAPEIARTLSRDGVRMGRSSHRLRNPDNAAPDWVAPILDDFVADPESRAPVVATLPDRRIGYVEAIQTKALCLTCHGAALAPELSTRIDELYPEDRAVGFEVGDLRGVFWVEFPPVE